MPHPAHSAVARRDSKLLRIRRLTLWITGAAAAASLGLGTAFAHALPGHSYVTRSAATTGSTSSYNQASQHPATHQSASGTHGSSRRTTSHPQHQKLATPTQAPAPAPSTAPPAPVVSSGGS